MLDDTYKNVILEKAAFRCFLVTSVQPTEVGSYDAMPLACLPTCMRILCICCRVAQSIRRILREEFCGNPTFLFQSYEMISRIT